VLLGEHATRTADGNRHDVSRSGSSRGRSEGRGAGTSDEDDCEDELDHLSYHLFCEPSPSDLMFSTVPSRNHERNRAAENSSTKICKMKNEGPVTEPGPVKRLFSKPLTQSKFLVEKVATSRNTVLSCSQKEPLRNLTPGYGAHHDGHHHSPAAQADR
jgi:hypothetical protein